MFDISILKNKLFLLGLALTALALTPFSFLSLLGFLAIGTVLAPLKTTRLVPRIACVFIAVYTFNAVISALFWIVDIHALQYINFINGLSLLTVIGLLKPSYNKISFDFVSLGVGLAVFIVPFIAYIKDPTFATLLQTFSYQGDNTSHIELINADVELEGYVYLGLKDIRPYAYQTLSGYPQGWHINVANIQQSISGITDIGASSYKQVLFFQLVTASFFSLLAMLLYESILLVGGRKNFSLPSKLVAASASIGLLYGTFMTLFAYGFQTHIASLVIILTMLLVLSEAYSTKNKSTQKAYVLYAASLCVGLSMTWQVIALPTGLGVLASLLTLRIIDFQKLFRERFFILTLLLLVIAAGFQFYILLRFGNDATTILQPGLSPEPRSSLILGLSGASLFMGFFVLKGKVKTPYILFFLSAFIFSALLYVILEIKVGEQRYYYFKTTFTVILLAILLLAGSAVGIIESFVKDLRKRERYLGAVLIILTGISGISANLSGETQKYFNSTLVGMDRPLSEVLANYIAPYPHERSRIYAIGSCIPDQDYKATRLAQALSADTKVKSYYASSPFDKPLDYAESLRRFSELSPERQTVIITHDETVLDYVMSKRNPEIDVVGINVDPHGPPKTRDRCPNFVEFKRQAI